MRICEKISFLMKERSMEKVEFADKLIALDTKLINEKSERQTIYRYLSGERELKMELAPYIAHILDVPIDDLFTYDVELLCEFSVSRTKQVKYMLSLVPYTSTMMIDEIIDVMEQHQKVYDESLKKLLSNKIKSMGEENGSVD